MEFLNYQCLCIPKQEYPHLTKSARIDYKCFFVPFLKNPRKPLLWVIENLAPAKSCDGHPIPFKKWELRIFNKVFKFGKIIY